MCCSVLQCVGSPPWPRPSSVRLSSVRLCVAVCCSMLQYVAVCCSVSVALLRWLSSPNVLQCVTVTHCVAVCHSVPWYALVCHCDTLQHSVPCYALVCHCVLQCVAVFHTVLQCSAVRCHRVPPKDQGVLQCECEALPLCCSALLTVLQCVVHCVAVRCAQCCSGCLKTSGVTTCHEIGNGSVTRCHEIGVTRCHDMS